MLLLLPNSSKVMGFSSKQRKCYLHSSLTFCKWRPSYLAAPSLPTFCLPFPVGRLPHVAFHEHQTKREKREIACTDYYYFFFFWFSVLLFLLDPPRCLVYDAFFFFSDHYIVNKKHHQKANCSQQVFNVNLNK